MSFLVYGTDIFLFKCRVHLETIELQGPRRGMGYFSKTNSSYRSYRRFHLQTRRKGQSCFVMTLSPRLCALLKKYLTVGSTPITAIIKGLGTGQKVQGGGGWAGAF